MARDRDGARAELERSLELLQTDHFELYQFHAVTSQEDVDRILAPGGAAEALLQARAVNFTLSLPVHGIPTVGDLRLLGLVLEAAERFRQLSQEEIDREIAGNGLQALVNPTPTA